MKRGVLSLGLMVVLMGSACAEFESAPETDEKSLDRANNYYARGRYLQASRIYRRTVEESPDSPYRKMALLSLADSLYKNQEYFEAPLYYERFIELYPLDPTTPRAVFYLAMCYYHDSFSAVRDQTNTRRAIRAFDGFVEVYPENKLTPFAKRYKREMQKKLATSELEVARFYHRLNKNVSAIRRLQEYLEKHPNGSNVPEALYLLGDCYYHEGAHKKAATIFTILFSKYPDSEFAEKATKRAEKILEKLKG